MVTAMPDDDMDDADDRKRRRRRGRARMRAFDLIGFGAGDPYPAGVLLQRDEQALRQRDEEFIVNAR